MEEANEDSFALNETIMGSAQKPLLFDVENGRILYGEQTLRTLTSEQTQELRNLLTGEGAKNPEVVLHSQNFRVLVGLKREEVNFLREKHFGLQPTPLKWLPGSAQCPVPKDPNPGY